MARGMRSDLVRRFEQAEAAKTCVTPLDAKDARRLHDALRRREVVSPAKGVYVRPSFWQGERQATRALCVARALASAHPQWVFCGVTGALVYGLSVSYALLSCAHVATTSKSHSRDAHGIARHVIDHDMHAEVAGLRVTSIERTVYDCLRSMSFGEGSAVVDSALHKKLTDMEKLQSFVARQHKNAKGYGRALATLAHADGRAESGGESIARAVMIEQGFMLPDLQREIEDLVDPNNCYFADFYWELPDGSVIIGELDGREKYENPAMTGGRSATDVLADERLRESRISVKGAKVMRFSFADVRNELFFVHLLETFGVPRTVPESGLRPEEHPVELKVLSMLRREASFC